MKSQPDTMSKQRHETDTQVWPPDTPVICGRCKAESPEGTEKIARIQLCGEWLCHCHYAYALDNESAYIKLKVAGAI